jgi:hypothetical protein
VTGIAPSLTRLAAIAQFALGTIGAPHFWPPRSRLARRLGRDDAAEPEGLIND